MKTAELRKLYLQYFESKQHKLFSSDSLVPKDDPTLLFTGAGMNQFKAYFLGIKKDVKRATSCQKCIRTADLENVGRTAYHQTFFEMLGNFSFGDYFKEEAIQYGWDFTTRQLKMNPEDLWVSVYQDDQEAYDIWKKKIGVNEKRIVRFGPVDNFWPSNAPVDGPNGPCGPCSEIYVGRVPGKGVEIWNLVFTEFDRQDGGFLKPLPQKNIDTGMGLERLSAVMQGVESNFETDMFRSILENFKEAGGRKQLDAAPVPLRNAILDHVRAATFALSDGVIPSNEGRGYVVRKLLRKAVLHLRSIGIEEVMLYRWAPAVAAVMGDAYPELKQHRDAVAKQIRAEEEAVWSIIEKKVPEAEIKIKTIALTVKPGQEEFASRKATDLAFEFYDTYGVPKEILEGLLQSNHLKFDAKHFDALLEQQRDRSRAGSKIAANIFSVPQSAFDGVKDAPTEFLGYERTKVDAKVVLLYSDGKPVKQLQKGQSGVAILTRTPFYAEQGGQVGDKGTIKTRSCVCTVEDAQWHDEWVLHHVEVKEGELHQNDAVDVEVDTDRRQSIMNNHTATHLLHSALRQVLGKHVQQRGSLVEADRLRFDFSHTQAVTGEQIQRVEELVNNEIGKQIPLKTEVKDVKQAMTEGAIAFFGEKYQSKVRVVSAGDFSKELCGGTHVQNTGHIGRFEITQEGSVQAGVRRVEAVTGKVALRLAEDRKQETAKLLQEWKATPETIGAKVAERANAVQTAQKRLNSAFSNYFQKHMQGALEKTENLGSLSLVVRRVDGVDKNQLRQTADWMRRQKDDLVVVLFSEYEGKPQLIIAISEKKVSDKLDANLLVKELSQELGGSGGGRKDLALGGGKPGADMDRVAALAKQKIAALAK